MSAGRSGNRGGPRLVSPRLSRAYRLDGVRPVAAGPDRRMSADPSAPVLYADRRLQQRGIIAALRAAFGLNQANVILR